MPFSTSPLTAKLFAGNELIALELDERRLLEDTATDDGAELEDTATEEGADELGTTDDGTEEEVATDERLDVVTADELGRLLLDLI